MKRTVVVSALFLSQLYVLLKANDWTGPDYNPILLLAISLLLPIYYLWYFLKQGNDNENIAAITSRKKIIGYGLGCMSILLAVQLLRITFWSYPEPYTLSDVLLTVDKYYDRFAAGDFPYGVIEEYAWKPYAPYLPLYWLPVAISRFFEIDSRWTGYILLVLCAGVYGIFCWKWKTNPLLKLLAMSFPLIAICYFYVWGRLELGISFEMLIAAYYLLLAAGLALRSLPLVVAGIICCLLSRFTVVFWLPLFVVLLWLNAPKKQFFISAAVVIAAVVLIYIIPFYAKDPTILSKGLDYYKGCAVAEWEGMGAEHVSWTFKGGVHFAKHIRDILSGSMEHRVSVTQTGQAILMGILVITGFALYRKWRNRINFYDFSLVMLYVIMLLYFMTSPLLFKYYYFTFMMVSAVVCGRIIMSRNSKESS